MLLRQNVKCVAFLTRKDDLGGSLSPRVETAGFHQDTYWGINLGSVFLGIKRLISQFLGIQVHKLFSSNLEYSARSEILSCEGMLNKLFRILN